MAINQITKWVFGDIEQGQSISAEVEKKAVNRFLKKYLRIFLNFAKAEKSSSYQILKHEKLGKPNEKTLYRTTVHAEKHSGAYILDDRKRLNALLSD